MHQPRQGDIHTCTSRTERDCRCLLAAICNQWPTHNFAVHLPRDGDGVIYPWDTYASFRALGFNLLLSTIAATGLHLGLSWLTLVGRPTRPSPVEDAACRSSPMLLALLMIWVIRDIISQIYWQVSTQIVKYTAYKHCFRTSPMGCWNGRIHGSQAPFSPSI